MGTDTAAQVRAIADTRERLERDLDVLRTRLPDREAVTTGAAIGAGTAVVAIASLWLGFDRWSRARERRKLAALLYDAGVEATGERPQAKGGAWKLLLGATAAGVVGAAGYAASKQALTTDEAAWVEP